LLVCKLAISSCHHDVSLQIPKETQTFMKWALLSDIHANAQALEACLKHARAQGVDCFAILGDVVGYGAQPFEVVDQVMQLAAQGAVVIRGNHDAMAVLPDPADLSVGASTAKWTHAQLNTVQRQFLANLPLKAQHDQTLFVHASAEWPERWRYIDRPEVAQACLDAAATDQAHRVFVGHVHHQFVYYRGTGRQLMSFKPTPGVPIPMPSHRQWVVTVGSVGQPRDGDPRAMYAMLDDAAQRLTFHRIPYDHTTAALAIRQAGLPEYFAKRLEDGR
jgi:diadenosine tetraphosphatase ApaH/serine/threonine PP2A family protein phosphatase